MAKKQKNDDCSFLGEDLQDSQRSSNYTFKNLNTRFKLLEMVIIQQYYIMKAAENLGIKLSTANYIIKCYRKNGKIFQKPNQESEYSQSQIQERVKDLKEREKKVNKITKKQHRALNKLLQKRWKANIKLSDHIKIPSNVEKNNIVKVESQILQNKQWQEKIQQSISKIKITEEQIKQNLQWYPQFHYHPMYFVFYPHYEV